MHDQAYEWGTRYATSEPVSVLEIGGRNINGTVKGLFPNAQPYTVLDLLPGPDVDIVADAATWTPDREYEITLSFECFEHTSLWREITATAFKACASGGSFILTAAGPGRAPHSAVDGRHRLFPGEFYANVEPHELETVLKGVGFVDVVVDVLGEDVRAYAVKP